MNQKRVTETSTKKKIQPFQDLRFYTFFPGSPTLLYDFMPFGFYDFYLIYI